MPKISLHDYQRKAVNFIYNEKRVGLWADPGLGKTAIILYLINQIKKHVKKVLIVAPSIVCANTWPDEILEWDQFKKLKHYQLNPNIRKNEDYSFTPEKAKIHLINFESIPRFAREGKLKNYDALFIDESSKLKNPGSIRFKELKKHVDHFEYLVAMSGTPTPKSIMDIWSQIFLIDKGVRLEMNITRFRNKYFNIELKRNGAYTFPIYTPKDKAEKKIRKKISDISYVIRAEDHLDIKKPKTNIIKIKLTEAEQLVYDKMEKTLFTKLGEAELLAKSSGGSYNMCHQMANGAIWKNEKKKELVRFHDYKLDVLENLIDELQGKPVLIGYRFKHDLLRLKERFGKRLKVLNKDKPKRVKRWNRGKIEILAGQFQSVSHGLNLQKGGNNIVFFSLTPVYEDYDQFIKRILRQGVKGIVNIHILMVRNTVDIPLYRLLKRRGLNQVEFLKELQAYRLEKTKSKRL